MIQAANFRIELNQTAISPDIQLAVQRVEYEEELNTPSLINITLNTNDFTSGASKFLDLESFNLAGLIRLYMGMDDVVWLNDGKIISIEPRFTNDGSTAEIRAYDCLHNLSYGKKIRTFNKKKDSELVNIIAGDWGLKTNIIDVSDSSYPSIFQNNMTDLTLLLARTERIGFELFARGDTIYFRKPKINQSPGIALEFGLDLMEFTAKLSSIPYGTEVKAQGWDYKNKKAISANARDGDEISGMSTKETGARLTQAAYGSAFSAIVNENIVDPLEAKSIAVAQYNNELLDCITAEGKCAGNPYIRIGNTIEINPDSSGKYNKSFGRFAGIYYITYTNHVIDDREYTTTFKLKRVGL